MHSAKVKYETLARTVRHLGLNGNQKHISFQKLLQV